MLWMGTFCEKLSLSRKLHMGGGESRTSPQKQINQTTEKPKGKSNDPTQSAESKPELDKEPIGTWAANSGSKI